MLILVLEVGQHEVQLVPHHVNAVLVDTAGLHLRVEDLSEDVRYLLLGRE